MPSERVQRWLKFLIAVGISVAFSVLFISGIDLDAVGQALADANYLYVVPALALFSLSVAVRALRWHYFLQPGFELSWRALLPSVLIGYAGNNLLPFRAGELIRAQHLSDRFAVPRMQTFGALLMERLFDGFLLATFVLWGLLLVDIGAGYLTLGLGLAGGTAVAGVICFLLARKPGFADWLAALPIPFVTSWLREQIAGLGASFFNGFSVLTSPGRFIGASVASAAAWGLELAMYWLIAEAFALKASLITVAFAGAAANVSLSIPAAQGGVGPFEVFATEALTRFEVAKDAAAAYALALHFFLIVPVSLVGLVVLWRTTLTGGRRAETAASVAEAGE